jgi:hypothetical protein
MIQWLDNVLVCEDGTLITQIGSVLEIRGEGWEGRKRKGDTPMTDRPRVCKLETDWQARKVAELVASFCDPNKERTDAEGVR